MMLKKMSDINNILVSNYGIFKAISNKSNSLINWLTSEDAVTLDLEYYLGVSGNKYISPIVERLYENDDSTYLSKIADIFILRYASQLKHIYDALNIDYEPLNNYDMKETENVGSEIKNDITSDNNIYGFNTTSEDGVPNSKNVNSSTTTGDFTKNKRELTRVGNIGVTSSQDLLNNEINTRRYDFYKYVMKCIDSIMCLSIR